MAKRKDEGRVGPRRTLVASVLDRLLDDHPDAAGESAAARPLLDDIRAAVRRDLENLLNSRRRLRAPAEDGSELERSVLEYGIPDLTGAGLGSSEKRESFLQMVEEVIRRCEPRLQQVHVVPLDEEEPLERALRFRIEAELIAEPAPEPIVFESELEPVSRTLAVEPGS